MLWPLVWVWPQYFSCNTEKCNLSFSIIGALNLTSPALYIMLLKKCSSCRSSGVFRGRATVRYPPLWPDHENFSRRLYMKRCVFYRFPARIAKFNNVWWSYFIPIQYAIKIAMWDCIWCDAVIFCVSEFQKKMGEFAAFIKSSKAKCFSFRGFAPWPPDQGLCLWTLLGALPPDPRYTLARSPWPPFAKS